VRRVWLLALAAAACRNEPAAPAPVAAAPDAARAPADAARVFLGKPHCAEPDCMPAFDARTIDGESLTSDDLRGRPAVVMFWASYCEPCIQDGPSIQTVYEAYKDQGLELVAFSRDEVEVELVRKFRARYQLRYPIVMATEAQFEAFGSPEHIPTFILYGRDGRVKLRMTGGLPAGVLEREVKRLL
jgi:peroxiredoxin